MNIWFLIVLCSLLPQAYPYRDIEPKKLRSLDQIELELIMQKVDLLKQRLAYLEKQESQDCSPNSTFSSDLADQMSRRNDLILRNFDRNTARGTINSLKLKNGNYLEREYVHS